MGNNSSNQPPEIGARPRTLPIAQTAQTTKKSLPLADQTPEHQQRLRERFTKGQAQR